MEIITAPPDNVGIVHMADMVNGTDQFYAWIGMQNHFRKPTSLHVAGDCINFA